MYDREPLKVKVVLARLETLQDQVNEMQRGSRDLLFFEGLLRLPESFWRDMRYTYSAAWLIENGINLPHGDPDREIAADATYRFVVTRDPDPYLSEADTYTALGYLCLGTAARKTNSVEDEIQEIRRARRQRIGEQSVLVAMAEAQTDNVDDLAIHASRGHQVTLNGVDPWPLMSHHKPAIDSMKLAISLETDAPARFIPLASGIQLTTDAGQHVFPLHFTMHAEMQMATGMLPDTASRINARYHALRSTQAMRTIESLFSAMSDAREDKLKTFMFAWAALEITITKLFATYEEQFLAPLIDAGQRHVRTKFLASIRKTMGGKYTLNDKFLAITATLFPDEPADRVQGDVDRFARIKSIRDSVFHGKQLTANQLPVDETTTLLRRYLLAHLQV